MSTEQVENNPGNEEELVTSQETTKDRLILEALNRVTSFLDVLYDGQIPATVTERLSLLPQRIIVDTEAFTAKMIELSKKQQEEELYSGDEDDEEIEQERITGRQIFTVAVYLSDVDAIFCPQDTNLVTLIHEMGHFLSTHQPTVKPTGISSFISTLEKQWAIINPGQSDYGNSKPNEAITQIFSYLAATFSGQEIDNIDPNDPLATQQFAQEYQKLQESHGVSEAKSYQDYVTNYLDFCLHYTQHEGLLSEVLKAYLENDPDKLEHAINEHADVARLEADGCKDMTPTEALYIFIGREGRKGWNQIADILNTVQVQFLLDPRFPEELKHKVNAFCQVIREYDCDDYMNNLLYPESNPHYDRKSPSPYIEINPPNFLESRLQITIKSELIPILLHLTQEERSSGFITLMYAYLLWQSLKFDFVKQNQEALRNYENVPNSAGNDFNVFDQDRDVYNSPEMQQFFASITDDELYLVFRGLDFLLNQDILSARNKTARNTIRNIRREQYPSDDTVIN